MSRQPQATDSDLVPIERERAVVDALKLGQRAALSDLFAWYGDRIYRQVVLPRLPQVELAEDVLATTFAKAAERIEQFELTDRSIFFWLRRIAINLCYDTHRRNQRDRRLSTALGEDPASPTASHLPSPDASTDQRESREMIEATLSQLNPRYAQALRMRLLEDQDREACAEALEVTIGNFDVILHRATKAFRAKYPPK